MKYLLPLAMTSAAVLLSACGGGQDTAPESDAPQAQAEAVASGITLQQRIDAAKAVVATNPACTSLSTPFYWEIGDKTGMLASGSGGTGSPAPTAKTPLPLASASKWVFATYVVEKQKGVLSTAAVKGLNMTSGYANANDCSSSASVASCLAEAGRGPGSTNGDYLSYLDGRFYYNSGHMQVLANSIGLGPNTNAPLAAAVTAVDATTGLAYVNPTLAGGGKASTLVYAQFLRGMLNGTYKYMPAMLGTNAVCTHTNGADCPSAAFSPLNESYPGKVNDISNEAWHYSLGHWVEDDPTVGDGAFSSTGRTGYYPWIDKSKTWYGVVARFDPGLGAAIPPGQLSMQCGRAIRKAWVAPPGATQ